MTSMDEEQQQAIDEVENLNDELERQLTKEQFSLVRKLVEAELKAESYCNT